MAIHSLVLVDGPPRFGKSTLARQLAASSDAGAILARAGSPEGRRTMANPLALSAARPVILGGAADGAAETPTPLCVGWRPLQAPAGWAGADPPITRGKPPSPGSPSQSHYTVACHTIAHLSPGPLTLAEVGRGAVRTHWLRGGYPEAYAAVSDSAAMENLETLIAGLSGGLLSAWGRPAYWEGFRACPVGLAHAALSRPQPGISGIPG